MIRKWIILAAIIILIIGVLSVLLIFTPVSNFDDYEVEEITDYSYLILFRNQKYGVIDTKGNIIIDCIYERVDIPNPTKPLFVCYINYDEQENIFVIKNKNYSLNMKKLCHLFLKINQ